MRSSSRASTNEAEESISYAPQDAGLEQQSERGSWEGTWGSDRRAPASFQRLMQTFVLGRCVRGISPPASPSGEEVLLTLVICWLQTDVRTL